MNEKIEKSEIKKGFFDFFAYIDFTIRKNGGEAS